MVSRTLGRIRKTLFDARVFQIVFLGSLLAAGAWFRDFSIHPVQIGLTYAAGIGTQALMLRALRLRGVGYLSAIVTSTSLSLLLRSDNLWAHPLAAAVAMSSKFLVRVHGKHLWNPGNLGVVFALLLIPGTWVSAGQWGHETAYAAWFFVLGAVVVNRARRGDISWAFLAFYLGFIAIRVLWLGQRQAVWTHQLTNGALLLFAFFMISDPMTIPNHPRARVLYAALVAAMGFCWQFFLFRTNGLLWALFAASLTVPLWDRIWPAKKFEWTSKGDDHEIQRTARPQHAASYRAPVPMGATHRPLGASVGVPAR